MKKKMFWKKIILLSLLLAGMVFICFLEARMLRPSRSAVVRLGAAEVSAEVAVTPAERYQGLSNRPYLAPENGLLYVFRPAETASFVMRKMEFPLDMIWIADGHIVSIDAQLPPEASEPYHRYIPPTPVDYVLEVNAGFCARHNLSVGASALVRGAE